MIDDNFLDEVRNLVSKMWKYPVTITKHVDENGNEFVTADMKADRNFFTNEDIREEDTPQLLANAIDMGLAMNIQSWNID